MEERSPQDLAPQQEVDVQGSAVSGPARKKLHSKDSCALPLSPGTAVAPVRDRVWEQQLGADPAY